MGEYINYQCGCCRKQAILLKEEICNKGYLKCPHCSSRNFRKRKETDSVRECMGHASYKKERGTVRQVR